MLTSVMTWEEAVLWLRRQDDCQELVRHCYYDDPLEQAAERFRCGEEWSATRRLLAGHLPGAVLDLGAGRGIVSFAFASEGCTVTALEPDPSPVVGRAAIERLRARTGAVIQTAAGRGEALPFEDNRFDVVYGRAVLHHAAHLPTLCREIARVLRPGGVALLVREHVITGPEDLPAFLAAHPLHHLYLGENAYPRAEYESALLRAGLRLHRVIGPLENPVNYFPATQAELNQHITDLAAQKLRWAGRFRGRLARLVLGIPGCRRLFTWFVSRRLETPGRHYAFLGVKP